MAVHVTLYRYTDEGMKGIKKAADIARGWQAEAQKRGVTVHALYWLEGRYDAITIVESDDEDAVMGLMLAIGAQGLLRTESMRAFSLEDVARFVQKVGA
ncbi:MAG TPA: GYD domain-containing protein [Chloroflexota bacterium]|nr:GYD domain-containing protein [Chloroflexota bacterium]